MPTEVVLGTPLAESLQNVVQSKLAEMGWSTGGLDDSALAEYILLMLVNGKPQDEIVSELSNDLLGLAPEDTSAATFTTWLFEQVEVLSGNGAPATTGDATTSAIQDDTSATVTAEGSEDAAMDEAMDVQQDQDGSIPTGPKSMRGGAQNARDRRMLGHVNKQLNDAALHKIKGTAGSGRINSHRSEPPKGPRSQNNRIAQNLQRPPRGAGMGQRMQQDQNMSQMAGMFGGMGQMTPQQQMQMFAMYEEQARMMASILSPQQQQMFPAQMAFNGATPPPQQGKSLFDRVDGGKPRQNGNYNKRNHNQNKSQETDAGDMKVDPTSSMDVELSQPTDPSTTMCHFNLRCTKADCPFVHQSPVAPPGITVDMSDTCSYGAACKNFKCVGKHPSPAKITAFKSQQECRFYPNCQNPRCPFEHPTTPACHNGADCTVPDCQFWHSKVVCKFDPCLNPQCPYKHAENQKRGAYNDKVWTSGAGGDHVSDRKFVDDSAQEELILPGGESQETVESTHPEGVIA